MIILFENFKAPITQKELKYFNIHGLVFIVGIA